jgi:glutathione peroxidase
MMKKIFNAMWSFKDHMTKLVFFIFLLSGLNAEADNSKIDNQSTLTCPSILNQNVLRLQDEKPQNLCQYSGRVVLVVNTASYCGFTPQYKGLEALYDKYKGDGLVVLGFPSNDFSQEPDNNQQIADFCENTFGVKFPMFTKTAVKGENASKLFKELSAATKTTPKWNFYKYLISRDGQKIKSFSSMTGPQDASFVKVVESFMNEKQK